MLVHRIHGAVTEINTGTAAERAMQIDPRVSLFGSESGGLQARRTVAAAHNSRSAWGFVATRS